LPFRGDPARQCAREPGTQLDPARRSWAAADPGARPAGPVAYRARTCDALGACRELNPARNRANENVAFVPIQQSQNPRMEPMRLVLEA
jgi:hypothetical protein